MAGQMKKIIYLEYSMVMCFVTVDNQLLIRIRALKCTVLLIYKLLYCFLFLYFMFFKVFYSANSAQIMITHFFLIF